MNATLNLLLTIVFQNNCYMFKLMQIKTELNIIYSFISSICVKIIYSFTKLVSRIL